MRPISKENVGEMKGLGILTNHHSLLEVRHNLVSFAQHRVCYGKQR